MKSAEFIVIAAIGACFIRHISETQLISAAKLLLTQKERNELIGGDRGIFKLTF